VRSAEGLPLEPGLERRPANKPPRNADEAKIAPGWACSRNRRLMEPGDDKQYNNSLVNVRDCKYYDGLKTNGSQILLKEKQT
jgi:hypothetical protein